MILILIILCESAASFGNHKHIDLSFIHQIHRDEAYFDKHGFNLKYIRANDLWVHLVAKDTKRFSQCSFSLVLRKEFTLRKPQQQFFVFLYLYVNVGNCTIVIKRKKKREELRDGLDLHIQSR